MRGTRLTAVGEELESGVATAPQENSQAETAQRLQSNAIQMLSIALKALSQRALIALSNLFMLLTAASVFALWYAAPTEPSIGQIVRLALYALFVLVLNVIQRRR